MKIIKKYYDRLGRLRILKGKNNKDSIIRLKIMKSGKEWPCCDFQGTCTNKAYAEVYPSSIKRSKKEGGSYLCKKHYIQEQKKFKGKLPACFSVEW